MTMTDQTGSCAPDSTILVARAPRKRVFKGAKAAFDNDRRSMSCTIRDLSDGGARLQFEGDWFIPQQFTLHVELDGYKLECERVWHKGGDCGVRFVSDRIASGQPRHQVIVPVLAGHDDVRVRQPDVRRDAEMTPVPRMPAARNAGFGRRTR